MVLSELKFFRQVSKDHHGKPVFLWTLNTEITNTQNTFFFLLKVGLDAQCSKANKKGKLALFWVPATRVGRVRAVGA